MALGLFMVQEGLGGSWGCSMLSLIMKKKTQKKFNFNLLLMSILVLVVGFASYFVLSVSAKTNQGILDPGGIPLYVIIEVNWDGIAEKADWTVWGPRWNPEIGGELITSCTNCLDANYDFKFNGKTVQFEETFVDTVNATPQVRHIVLRDDNGDGTYNGSEAAQHYFPWAPEPDGSRAKLYFDRIDYELTFDGDRNLTNFHYIQYEHKKL